MNKQSFWSARQLRGHRPHLVNVMIDETNNAFNNHKKSEKFLQLKEDYLSSKEYRELFEKFEGENTAKEYVNWIKKFVKNFYKEDTPQPLKSFLADLINENRFLNSYYNLTSLQWEIWGIFADKEITLDNYTSVLEEVVTKYIDDAFDRAQEQHAINKMHLTNNINYRTWERFDSVLASAPTGTLETLETYIKNSFDFKELTIDNDNDNKIVSFGTAI